MTQRGFTLLELVAAMAIFALMAVMAYGGLDAVLKTRAGLESSYDRIERWQRGIHRLRDDLEQTRMRGIRDEFGDPQAPLWTPESGRVELTRGGRRNPLLLPRATLERVAYFVEDGDLIRQSWPVLDRTQATESSRLVLLTGIDGLRWRFLPVSDDEWVEDWPRNAGYGSQAPATETLPRAVELELETKDFGLLRLIFAVVVP